VSTSGLSPRSAKAVQIEPEGLSLVSSAVSIEALLTSPQRLRVVKAQTIQTTVYIVNGPSWCASWSTDVGWWSHLRPTHSLTTCDDGCVWNSMLATGRGRRQTSRRSPGVAANWSSLWVRSVPRPTTSQTQSQHLNTRPILCHSGPGQSANEAHLFSQHKTQCNLLHASTGWPKK